MDYQKAEETGRALLRARELFAYGGLDGVLNRPLLNSAGTYPHFATKAEGYRITDGNGREYIDWINGWSSVILGHNHEAVREAIIKQATCGTFITLMHPVEMEVAESIIELVPNAEMVAFGKNGSDSVTAAIRIARAHTGREVVLQHGFHGFHDWFVCTNPKVRGVLDTWKRYVEPFPYNDLAALEDLFAKHSGNVAAIVMEPVNFEQPDANYLVSVKALAKKHGAILIWDEVVTAFRLAQGGAQEYFGVEPDLVVLGKAMGNGMPLSAVAGPKALMKVLPETGYGMTFRGESISLAAANTCLKFMGQNNVADHLIRIGKGVISEFDSIVKSAGVECELVGVPSRMAFKFESQNGRHPRELKSIFVLECLKHGVLTNGNVLPTFAHDSAAIEQSMEVFAKAIAKVRESLEEPSRSQHGQQLPFDASTLIVRGVIGGFKFFPHSTVVFGWLLVDGLVPDSIQMITEEGETLSSELILRPDLVAQFPDVENADKAGFRFNVPVCPVKGRCRRMRIVASQNGVERFHCLVVDDEQLEPGVSGERMGPFPLRDGVVFAGSLEAKGV